MQAHYLALAGVERAKALIYQDVVTAPANGQEPYRLALQRPKDFQDVPLGRGKFQVFRRAPQEEGGGIVYGIGDEESRLNLNSASADQLKSQRHDVRYSQRHYRLAKRGHTKHGEPPGGANSDYYMSLRPPYLARNGPFQTVRELVMVRGETGS